jgi:hypothetical protein
MLVPNNFLLLNDKQPPWYKDVLVAAVGGCMAAGVTVLGSIIADYLRDKREIKRVADKPKVILK